MLSKESGGPNNNNSNNNFDLPEEVLEVLPLDPFEQLDVAHKITSIALSTRISSLESEASVLRRMLTDKEAIIADLQSQLESLDASLSDASDKLAHAEKEKEDLLEEKATLSNTVKKLNRDVAKLEAFRKTLMRSLQDDEDHSAAGLPVAGVQERSQTEDDASLPPTSTPSMQSQFSDTGSTYSEDKDTEGVLDSRPRMSPGLLLASQTSTPRLTPPGSPPSQSASGLDTGSPSGRTRVDAKEFFRQVRGRLPYEQFGAFLANVKELNSHKQTKEETLCKADEIFGPENKDLYAIFEGLITRNIHWKE